MAVTSPMVTWRLGTLSSPWVAHGEAPASCWLAMSPDTVVASERLLEANSSRLSHCRQCCFLAWPLGLGCRLPPPSMNIPRPTYSAWNTDRPRSLLFLSFCLPCLLFLYLLLRQDLTVYPQLALTLQQTSLPCLPSAWITGKCHHTHLLYSSHGLLTMEPCCQDGLGFPNSSPRGIQNCPSTQMGLYVSAHRSLGPGSLWPPSF